MNGREPTALAVSGAMSAGGRPAWGRHVPTFRRSLPHPSWRRLLLLGAAVAVAFLVSPGAEAQGRVTLLQPTPASEHDWPAATRATLAELALAGFEVNVKRTRSNDLTTLLEELRLEALRRGVVAALVIARERNQGTAHVWVSGATVPLQMSELDPDAPISQSSLALRLAELLRERHVRLPPSIPPVREQDALPSAELGSGSSFGAIAGELGFGVARVNGASAAVGRLGVRWAGTARFSAAADFQKSIDRLAIDTAAGPTDVGWTSLRATAWFDPLRQPGFYANLGVSWGPVWLASRASDTPEYRGRSATTTTSLLSAAGQVGYRWGAWCFDISVEPGVMLPRVRVLAMDTEVESLGRVWLNTFALLRWET